MAQEINFLSKVSYRGTMIKVVGTPRGCRVFIKVSSMAKDDNPLPVNPTADIIAVDISVNLIGCERFPLGTAVKVEIAAAATGHHDDDEYPSGYAVLGAQNDLLLAMDDDKWFKIPF